MNLSLDSTIKFLQVAFPNKHFGKMAVPIQSINGRVIEAFTYRVTDTLMDHFASVINKSDRFYLYQLWNVDGVEFIRYGIK